MRERLEEIRTPSVYFQIQLTKEEERESRAGSELRVLQARAQSASTSQLPKVCSIGRLAKIQCPVKYDYALHTSPTFNALLML